MDSKKTSKATQKSTTFKDVNENQDLEFTERRRVPRLNLTTEQFRLSPHGKVFPVSNLSRSGMGIRVLDPADLFLFTVGRAVSGSLNLHREKFPVTGAVRRVSPESVGIEFADLPAATVSALQLSLDPKVLGQELRPIPSAEKGMTWYHGPSGTDLLVWRGIDGQYNRLAIFVLGSYVQWDSDDGVSTGTSRSSDECAETRGVMRMETLLLSRDAKPEVGKLEIAKTLLLSSNLPGDLKSWCVRQLSAEH